MATFHLYSDGNYFPRAKKSGFGGYIEDPQGQVMVEYTEQIKQTNYAYSFELLGIIRGLQIAQSMGVERIISHCDDKHTVGRLQEVIAANSTQTIPESAKPELYQQIMDLLKSFKSATIEYIPREQNKHSDALSRRYSTLMEQNFVRQYKEDLIFSENALLTGNKPGKRIFFCHPAMVKNYHKNNPFSVSQYRNRKVRKTSKAQLELDYQYLFVETNSIEDKLSLNIYHYKDANSPKKLLKELVVTENEPYLEMFAKDFCECLEKIKVDGAQNVWINSNSRKLANYFEQRDKIPNIHFHTFATIANSMNGFENIYCHALPFEHSFNPTIEKKEKKKKDLGESIQTIEAIIEQLQNGDSEFLLERNKKKYFGMLVNQQLRDYKKLLERELNEIEKNDIIAKTTKHFNDQGIWSNSTKPKSLKM